MCLTRVIYKINGGRGGREVSLWKVKCWFFFEMTYGRITDMSYLEETEGLKLKQMISSLKL